MILSAGKVYYDRGAARLPGRFQSSAAVWLEQPTVPGRAAARRLSPLPERPRAVVCFQEEPRNMAPTASSPRA
ncbi:MAG: hypothetical protein R3A51_02055 [Nannocystaceae bacterium]